MRRFVLPVTALSIFLAGGMANGQATNPNPVAHQPDVFLSNHKPAKKGKDPTTRAVSGQVTDDTGQPLQGALVTLTDTKTKEKTNFFTKKDGRYHFEDLSFNIDYGLAARYKDKSSETRKLSQYDHSPNPVRILSIVTDADTAKPPATTASQAPPAQKQ